ncbi:MAG: polymerase sigma-70 factor, subfamily [Actinomycetota bacterium]|jgi:RNA polymerase sigma-70 factor (ECF subfamily)
MPSFSAVIEAARAGGEWAFEVLFRDYQPALLRYLRGQAPDIADDVASETWIAVAAGLRGFEGDADDFRAWLFTIGRHRLIDERRREKRRVLTSALTTTQLLEVVGDDNPETTVIDAVGGDLAAQRIVALLPADQADVILLRVVADLSVDQVAEVLGKKPGHVRTLQSRGLKRLAERISEKPVTP